MVFWVDIQLEGHKTLQRLLADIDLSDLTSTKRTLFISRVKTNFPALFDLLHQVYGQQYDFYYYLQELLQVLKQGIVTRKPALQKKDKLRLKQSNWFRDESMLGMACYVDLFAGDVKKLEQKIPYLVSLGVSYLHLMPLYKSPEGDSDGGYAVSDYRTLDAKLGTMNEFKKLADALAKAGINLVLDFVFNHTSDEHEWALKAKQGDEEFQNYYWMFDNKDTPNQFEQNLREIFPQVRRGNFTYNDDSKKWVWTTFNSFQWDLNYSNPAVFNAITSEMLFLANLGCDALRLDALAFIWKEMGSTCENQPKAHALIQAFNRCLKIVAPAVVFKSEAIVHPDEVLKYIDKDECEVSYNPLLMALLWDGLATRKTNLLSASMQKSFGISGDCTWVNYARCHDDIGWTFDDDVAASLGINSYDHRHFLNQFYTGRFEGSFAKGVAFAENSATGDCRVCGSLASLAGLEQALELNDAQLISNAIKRILLIHSIILSIGGIPLLYSGDELGLLNDYEYKNDPAKEHDDRWVHRIPVTPAQIAKTQVAGSAFYDIAQGLEKMIKARKEHRVFGDAHTHILQSNNEHLFVVKRTRTQADLGAKHLLAICNFSEHEQSVNLQALDINMSVSPSQPAIDILTNTQYGEWPNNLCLSAYQVIWLLCE